MFIRPMGRVWDKKLPQSYPISSIRPLKIAAMLCVNSLCLEVTSTYAHTNSNRYSMVG